MATKAAVDDFVVERRLRPIYEWLDVGLSRKAIQECDKVLKKQPGLQCARVLKGLALLRSGKSDEAEHSIQQVVGESPTNDGTLQALTIYFREIDEYDRICSVYEEATKKAPKNEELLSHLFMSYVRVGEYKKQQLSAMALYKQKPKNPYYFWAVISLVMQSQFGNASNRGLCLALAERMVEKFYKEGKLETEAQVLAYLYILELQEKYVDALDLVDSDLSERITQQPANFLPLKRVTYHLALQQWQQAHDITKSLMGNERDNWQHYENFCKSLLQLHAAGDISVFKEGCEFLRSVLSSSVEQHGTKYRAPYLALMLLAHHLHKANLQDALQHLDIDVGCEMLSYLRVFGLKWCAFSDVRLYFPMIPREAVQPLLTGLRDLVTLEDDVPTDVYMLHRHLTWLQVSRCLQPNSDEISAQTHLSTADHLLMLYNRTHHLACQTTPTDIRRNDIYLLLAGHSVLHAISMLTDSDKSSKCSNGNSQEITSAIDHTSNTAVSELLLKLIGNLEAAVASSKANFQLKLLLLQLFNLIGACGSGRSCYDSLEIKSVQLDTLGHVSVLQAMDAAHYNMAAAICSATNCFFVSAAKDTCEPMIQAYKYGSLTRVPEFARFKERLQQSVHFAYVTVEQMLLELTYTVCSHKAAISQLQMKAIDPVTDTTDYTALVDNADLSVKIDWSTTLCVDPDTKGRPCAATLTELRVRQLTLRLLGAAYNASLADVANGEQQLTDVVLELEQLRASQEGVTTVGRSVRTAGCRRVLGIYISRGYVAAILHHARLLLHMHHCYTVPGEKRIQWQQSHLTDCEQSVSTLLREALQSVTKMQCIATTATPSNTLHLHNLHHTSQTIGIISILLGFCSSIMRSSKSSKKSKKKKDVSSQIESVSEFVSYTDHLDEQLETVQSALSCKLEIVKTNSCNNAPAYARLSSNFAPEPEIGATEEAEVVLKQLVLDDRPHKNGIGEALAMENGSDAPLRPVAADLVKTCLTIDASYQESLANLKTAISAKRKYLISVKL